ncbi:hypothetical protein [Amaricoccus solimangrovi]|uniref:Uncharacterized protein n=1 Tax=Amaricoccus solimangrovi TaxID=2589815 RepID=A0A501WKL3_9RHOB|nr:hypothetical protein [Amaricoccus solimangrovi]TPE47727.1 hypothetical protein FJM51_19605 [Amaricoccus solimangrovi]
MGTIGTEGAGGAILPDVPGPSDTAAALARVLATPKFRQGRRRSMLAYLVEETLTGRGDRLKGYTIATAVFGRGDDFNAQSDPVVRLEARRLRRDLDGYYAEDGRLDPVRLSIPKGGYAVRSEWREIAAAPATPPPPPPAEPVPDRRLRRRRGARFAAGCALAAAAALLAAFLAGRDAAPPIGESGPSIIVLPFTPNGAEDEVTFLAEGISQQLITELKRFDALRVFSAGASFGESGDADAAELHDRLGVSYVVSGGVTATDSQVRVNAMLVDAASGEVKWSESFDRRLDPGDLLAAQGDMAAGIAMALGQPYGAVKGDVTARVLSGAVPSMASYACVLRAHIYRRSFPPELYAPTRACLEEAVRRDPSYAEAWALLGWLEMDGVRFDFTPGVDRDAVLGEALSTARRGSELDPENVTALKALASIEYYAGYYDESERTQRAALALNPNDPDTLAQLGWRLAARGKWDEGVPLLQRAIARSIRPPGWYYHLIAIHQYLERDYAAMLETAGEGAAEGSPTGQALIAIAAGALGDAPTARAALARMRPSNPGSPPIPPAISARTRAQNRPSTRWWPASAGPAGPARRATRERSRARPLRVSARSGAASGFPRPRG